MVRHVVILAFSARHTRRAVERTRRMVPEARVHVVPAWRHVGRGIGALRSSRVAITDAPGRAGLEAALDDVEGTALLVHDDVLVVKGALRRMEQAHRRSGQLVLPHSNELETTGYIGSLPPARRAEPAVTASMDDAPGGPATHFRTSCALGTPEQVRRLADARATDPRSIVNGWHEPVQLAPGAVVAHDSDCAHELPPPDGPEGRPLLLAALIARDEEEMLPACLASLDGLVDRIVVGDTGSVDDTVRVARSFGAEVVDVPWQDDFAAARNAVLDHCRDAWFVLQVDADERLVCPNPVAVRRRLAADVDEPAMFRVRIDNIAGGEVYSSFEAPRLYRPDGVTYAGALHEVPVEAAGHALEWVGFGGLHLVHLGYDPVVVERRDKKRRNVDIARRHHRESPSLKTALNLLRSLAGEDQEAELQMALSDELLANGHLTAEMRAHVLGIRGARIEGRTPDEARTCYREALELAPADDLIARQHAAVAFAAEDFDEVLRVAASRRSAGDRGTFRSPRERAAELHYVALAHLAVEDPTSALDTVDELLALAAPLSQQQWRDVVSLMALLDPEEGLYKLVEPAARATDDTLIRAVVDICGPEVATEFARHVCEAGGATGHLVRTGLVSALVTDARDAFVSLASYADRLEPAEVDRLMQRAAERGNSEAAQALAAELLAGSRT